MDQPLPAGAFTTRQAREAGFSPHAIRARVLSGEWLRLGQAVWIRAEHWVGLSAEARHRHVVEARLLVLRPGWMAARRSAAVVHGLPLIGSAPAKAQLVAAPLRLSDRASSRHERLASIDLGETVEVDGLPCTSLARTVVDIARSETLGSSMVVADAALRVGLPRSELLGVARRCASWPGAAAADRVVRGASPAAETPLESISRCALLQAGLPLPELQSEIWCGSSLVARVDFLWRGRLTIGEADGRLKYLTPADLYAEKRREDRLRELGFEVVRWGWDDIWNRTQRIAGAVSSAFGRSEGRQLDARVRITAYEQSREDRAA